MTPDSRLNGRGNRKAHIDGKGRQKMGIRRGSRKGMGWEIEGGSGHMRSSLEKGSKGRGLKERGEKVVGVTI